MWYPALVSNVATNEAQNRKGRTRFAQSLLMASDHMARAHLLTIGPFDSLNCGNTNLAGEPRGD